MHIRIFILNNHLIPYTWFLRSHKWVKIYILRTFIQIINGSYKSLRMLAKNLKMNMNGNRDYQIFLQP